MHCFRQFSGGLISGDSRLQSCELRRGLCVPRRSGLSFRFIATLFGCPAFFYRMVSLQLRAGPCFVCLGSSSLSNQKVIASRNGLRFGRRPSLFCLSQPLHGKVSF
mmetsp:Transcript_80309/g.215259  ORF Transcript_80309/g.215259 Transcript_80309/m.215259 type:complete len:106 (-) Transcript_80309:1626-1943(-)